MENLKTLRENPVTSQLHHRFQFSLLRNLLRSLLFCLPLSLLEYAFLVSQETNLTIT